MIHKHDIAFIDFDKTIYDLQIPLFEEYRKKLSKQVAEKFGITDSFYPILENTHKISHQNPELKKYIHDYIDEMEDNASGYFYSYTEKLLSALSAKMPVLIVSNNSSYVIKKRLNEKNMSAFIKYVYGRDTFDYFKPMGEVLSYSCEQSGILPESLNSFIYIGDSWRDYKCAADFASKNNLSYTFLHPNSLTGNEIIKNV